MMLHIPIQANKKVFFISDFHLGNPNDEVNRKKEKSIVAFLDSIKDETSALFLVGDVFDFWFEYKYVVPKGFVRVLGKLAEFHDAGIPIHFFVGNHDMWSFTYFTEEFGAKMYYHPTDFQIGSKRFHIGHGDGLGPGDRNYKFLKLFFRNPFTQWLFSVLPASIGMGIAHYWSKTSRAGNKDEKFWGEKEWLIQYCEELDAKTPFDYYLFGHRHHLMEHTLKSGGTYFNLGDWINYNSYAEFDGTTLKVKQFEK